MTEGELSRRNPEIEQGKKEKKEEKRGEEEEGEREKGKRKISRELEEGQKREDMKEMGRPDRPRAKGRVNGSEQAPGYEGLWHQATGGRARASQSKAKPGHGMAWEGQGNRRGRLLNAILRKGIGTLRLRGPKVN